MYTYMLLPSESTWLHTGSITIIEIPQGFTTFQSDFDSSDLASPAFPSGFFTASFRIVMSQKLSNQADTKNLAGIWNYM